MSIIVKLNGKQSVWMQFIGLPKMDKLIRIMHRRTHTHGVDYIEITFINAFGALSPISFHLYYLVVDLAISIQINNKSNMIMLLMRLIKLDWCERITYAKRNAKCGGVPMVGRCTQSSVENLLLHQVLSI